MLVIPITRQVISPIIGGLGSGRPSWSIARLFANGEQGAWYDPSDLSTLFQDSSGTTPVTAAGQPVGLMLDKSGRGNHARQPAASSRPLLRQNATTGAYYLEFDGADDFMSTTSINFTGTDKMSVFAGVRKLSDVGTQVLAEFSAASGSNVGSFGVFAPRNAGTAQYGFRLQGSTGSDTDVSSFASPITNVLSCAFDIAGATITDEMRPRINGASPTRANTGQAGTGNFGNYPLYLGRRGGTSLPFTGHLYGLIIRGALTDDPATIKVEKVLAGKAGVTLA